MISFRTFKCRIYDLGWNQFQWSHLDSMKSKWFHWNWLRNIENNKSNINNTKEQIIHKEYTIIKLKLCIKGIDKCVWYFDVYNNV